MKKKYFVSVSFLLSLISIFLYFNLSEENNVTLKEVSYNGDGLLVSIDGVTSTALPTSGNYYLVSYDCKNKNTKLSWDRENNKLNVTNGTNKADVACYLEFKTNPKLSEMPVGSYVKYVGKGGMVGSTPVMCQNNGDASSSTETYETEAPNSCLGQNAREDIDENGNTYGYCYSSSSKYYTTGWRIAYIDDNNKPVIVSAGSPECNTRTSSTANATYIKMANSLALKYCNSDYVDGDCSCVDSDSDGYCDCTDSDEDGLCDEIENGDLDAWAISDIDFYNMTKAISGVGKRLYSGSSGLGDSGGTLGTKLYCGGSYSREECGYNNDLIDNGGSYWFAARYSSSSTIGVYWDPYFRDVGNNSFTKEYGLRPVISLSSSVEVTGGSGAMEDPYVIGNSTFQINDGSRYINSSDDLSNVVLSLTALSDVTQMCISVNSSGCSNYIDFASTYTLDWSSESDGEKIVYVYYKNSAGEVVASMSRSIELDVTAPSNNSISIGSESGLTRTLTISSTDADYMCFSNTSSSASDCVEWVSYATSYLWKLTGSEGEKTVYAFFKDEAGNVSNAVSDTITYVKECLGVGEVYTIDYSGDVTDSDNQEVNFCAGSYTLQVWGAQGGNTGGNGGYSIGDITLTGTEMLYFYVGGAGAKGTAGFNGGGSTGSGGGAGGGATDIRINTDSLYARVIVAGGGGGKGQDSCAAGGAGGGTSGIGGNSQSSCGTQGGAGTQTSGGAVGVYSSTNGANAGSFGVGGSATDGSYDGGGGGGGWYGGGAGASAGWSNGGGGGSGFVLTTDTVTNVPSGYLLETSYYLTNASTIDGTQSTIPTTDGTSTETGHTGNGFIKITRIS